MSDHSTPALNPRKAGQPQKLKKPKKPCPDFPLTPPAVGAWQKKITGRIYYFGRWTRMVNGKLERVPGDGWKEALEQHQKVADDLHAGRRPRVDWDGLTVVELCDRFLVAKNRKLEARELSEQAMVDYKLTTDLIVATFGRSRPVADLRPEDFEKLRAKMAERWGPVRLANTITRIKSISKYGFDNGLLDKPVRFGSEFKKPDKAVLRRHRAKRGELMLEAGELRSLIAAARQPLKAMVLLGVNAGLGNFDVATLQKSALDFDAGWLDFPRTKTGIPRRAPLWPETVAAIREALAARPRPREKVDAECVVLTEQGRRWVRNVGTRNDNVGTQFRVLLGQLGMRRPRIGFYTLRHVFRTVADAARDPVAADLIMGHTEPSMAGEYRERIDDERLVAVAEHVRQWLIGGQPEGGPANLPRQPWFCAEITTCRTPSRPSDSWERDDLPRS
jgi:integrase